MSQKPHPEGQIPALKVPTSKNPAPKHPNGQDAPEAAKSAEGYIAKQNGPKGTSLRKRRFWFSLTPKG